MAGGRLVGVRFVARDGAGAGERGFSVARAVVWLCSGREEREGRELERVG